MVSGDPTHGTDTPTQPRRFRRGLRSRQETRARRRQVVTWILFGVSSVLMINALVGEHGYLATLRADREYATLRDDLDAILDENRQLQQEADRLATDPNALEEIARRELGLVKPGETVVILKDSSAIR